jgi:hypothetical protein
MPQPNDLSRSLVALDQNSKATSQLDWLSSTTTIIVRH